jgi:hypothetical protein
LNILRLVILDAPLSSAVRPFVGDAILSSILGYDDSTWGVRNSATMVFSAAMLRVVDSDKNASNTDTTSSNAITITELFRRYPPLAPVLLATMRKALADTSKMDGAESLAFPALLLLSRVAPVASSGETASSLIESFPPVVCKSLSSNHHAIREAAARALANICTEEHDTPSSSTALLAHIKDLIETGLSAPCDWNLVDGALLGASALISSSNSSRIAYHDIEMSHVLLRVLVPTERQHVCPPSSMCTALGTLITMFQDDESTADEAPLTNICREITHKRGLGNLIGGARLLSTTAVTFCRLVQNALWSPQGEQSFRHALDDTESLLSSNLIDVRLAAVKYFKKCIYTNIDNLLAITDTTRKSSPPREDILSSIARMLLRCTYSETARRNTSDDRIGAHIPTERRLSRCFLECFQGYCVVVERSSVALSSFIDGEEYSKLRTIAARMTEQEDLLSGEREINGETFLSGNAVEMLAIVVAFQLNSEKPLDTDTLECIDTFVTLVQKVNDQDASWRSRYSAAVSIEISQLLDPDTSVPGKYRQTLLFQVLGMLQDLDPDVRASAGRAAGRLLRSVEASYTLLPELMLDKAYPLVFHFGEHGSYGTIAEALVNTLLQNCSGILDTMQHLEEEFNQTSKESVSALGLVNATTSRKIFEEGDCNPYQERVLINQLICRTLVGMDSNDIGSTIYGELMSICYDVLRILLKNQGRGGMAHDMTRFPTIFPSLNGLLLGATVALYFGAQDAEGVRTNASRLVTSSDGIFFHPDVLLTLQNLSQAKASDPSTKEAIVGSSFLLTEIAD